jgi:hypothetical protein
LESEEPSSPGNILVADEPARGTMFKARRELTTIRKGVKIKVAAYPEAKVSSCSSLANVVISYL